MLLGCCSSWSLELRCTSIGLPPLLSLLLLLVVMLQVLMMPFHMVPLVFFAEVAAQVEARLNKCKQEEEEEEDDINADDEKPDGSNPEPQR
jgi:hypothetical protein